MTLSPEFHLEVVPFARDGSEGLAVVSTHPLMGTPRIAVVSTGGPTGLLVGTAYLDENLEFAVGAALASCTSYAKAGLAIELAGASPTVDAVLEALSYPHDLREAASAPLLSAIAEARGPGLASAVDPRGVEALRATADASLIDLQFYSGDGDRPERRRQAAASFPILATTLSSTLSLKMAVDRAKPLLDAVVSAMDARADGTIGRATIRKLAAVREAPFLTDVDTVMEFASRISPDWIPTSGEEWRSFCMVAEGVVRQLGIPAPDTASFLKGCGGRWTEFCRRMSTASGADADAPLERSLPQAFADVGDMVECFADVVVMPAAAHGHRSSDAMVTPEIRQLAIAASKRMLLGTRAGPAAVETARRWHIKRTDILGVTRLAADERRMELIGDVPDGGWPMLTDAAQAPNGVWLVPLDTPTLLKWEGAPGVDPNGAEGLDHCVYRNGYANKCLKGDCHIVSVCEIREDGSYRRLSTIEFARLSPTSDVLSIIQNRSRGNGEPPGPAKDATAWYVDMVARGEIPLRRERITAFQELMQGTADGVERFCGYDWKDREVLDVAAEPWGPFLDARYRSWSTDDLIASADVAGIGAAFAPELLLARR